MVRLFVILVLGCLPACYGGSWTNKAGHAVSGDLIELKGNQIAIQLSSGTVRNFPLAAFRADQQDRIKLACGQPDIPDGLRASHAFTKRQIKRAGLLKEQGQMNAEEYEKLCSEAKRVFRLSAGKKVPDAVADALCEQL